MKHFAVVVGRTTDGEEAFLELRCLWCYGVKDAPCREYVVKMLVVNVTDLIEHCDRHDVTHHLGKS